RVRDAVVGAATTQDRQPGKTARSRDAWQDRGPVLRARAVLVCPRQARQVLLARSRADSARGWIAAKRNPGRLCRVPGARARAHTPVRPADPLLHWPERLRGRGTPP